MIAAIQRPLAVLMTCLSLTLAPAAGLAPVSFADTGPPVQTVPPPQSIKGELVLITDEFFLVKDAVGNAMVQVLVSKATKVEQPIRMGDKVVAELSQEGVATSIKRAR